MARKRVVVVSLVTVAVLAVGAYLLLHRQGITPLGSSTVTLADIQRGLDKADNALKSGKGKMTIYEWQTDLSGAVLERNTDYSLQYSGDRFKVTVKDSYKRTWQPVKGARERVGQVVKRVTSPNYSNSPLADYQIRCDSTSATRYSSSESLCLTLASNDPKACEWVWVYIMVSPQWPPIDLSAHVIKDGPVGPYPSPQEYAEAEILGQQQTGGRCIVVEQKQSRNISVIYWICPEKGYSILRLEMWAKNPVRGKKFLMQEVNNRVREYKPGLWGPTRMEALFYALRQKTGEPYLHTKRIYTYARDFEFGLPESKLDLKLKLPKGTTVVDEVKHKTHVVK